MSRVILHSDLNNFYASVELLSRPELRDKPVAVAGDPEARHGIVLAKNYVAKARGVQTGEPLWQARGKCPDIVFYRRITGFMKNIRKQFGKYTTNTPI